MSVQATGGSDVRAPNTAWWVLVLLGLVGIAAGVIVLAQPTISLATLAVIAGIFMLIDGVVEVSWSLFGGPEDRALIAILGVVSAIVGVVLIRHPVQGVTAFALLLGLWLIVAGVVRLVREFSLGEVSIWSVLLGLLELAGGIVIVASPGIGVTTLALLVGISFIVRGLAVMLVGWALHSPSSGAASSFTGRPRPVH